MPPIVLFALGALAAGAIVLALSLIAAQKPRAGRYARDHRLGLGAGGGFPGGSFDGGR